MPGKSLCCVKLTIGARLIGVVGLIVSVFAMKQLMMELTEDTAPECMGMFLVGVHPQIKSDHRYITKHEVNYYVVCCLLFSMAYIFSTALLIWGTIVEERWCTIPWMIGEIARLFAQIGGLIYYGLTEADKRPQYKTWQLVVSGVSIGMSFYMLVVVWFAQLTWVKETQAEQHMEPNVHLREVPRIIIEEYDGSLLACHSESVRSY